MNNIKIIEIIEINKYSYGVSASLWRLGCRSGRYSYIAAMELAKGCESGNQEAYLSIR